MEQQKLPNVTLAMVLAIIGYVCCCVWGLPAIVLGLIGLLVLQSDLRKYRENPEGYSNYSQWKTARILCIISVAVGAVYLSVVIFQIMSMGGWSAYMETVREFMDQYELE